MLIVLIAGLLHCTGMGATGDLLGPTPNENEVKGYFRLPLWSGLPLVLALCAFLSVFSLCCAELIGLVAGLAEQQQSV